MSPLPSGLDDDDDDDDDGDDDDVFPPHPPINLFPPSRIQQPNFILNLSPPFSPDLDGNSLNQLLYPKQFDKVLGKLAIERRDDIKLS